MNFPLVIRRSPGAFVLALVACIGASSVPVVRLQAQVRDAREEVVDTAAVGRIRREAVERSQVMELTSWLTDVMGPRLTGTPESRKAGEWARERLAGWGLRNAALEPWAGDFGQGWTNERFVAAVVAPTYWPVIGYPSAWTAGTDGPRTVDVVYAPMESEADLAKWKGRLQGKLVLVARPRDVAARFEPLASRYSDDELARLGAWKPEAPRQGAPAAEDTSMQRRMAERRAAAAFATRRAEFLRTEGALGQLTQGAGDGGTVFNNNGGNRDASKPKSIMQLVLAAEHYGRIARTLEKGVPVRMEVDVRNRFYPSEGNLFNVVAEIPGTDPALKDEVVMLGAHFDSWHTGTGATDNAAGSTVMMEAVRILQALKLPMKRTVRIALWTGEEQGLYGSRAYVRQHFGDRETMRMLPAHEKLVAYYNVDNGTGKIRGVYAQGNEAAAEVFAQWLAPFASGGASTVTLRNTGGTDHLSFDAIGLPGFQFVQDAVEYGSRTHHSNMDVYERVQADDMKHNAAVVASFVYLTANRAERLPRKPMPAPAARTAGSN